MACTSSVCKPRTPNAAARCVALAVGILVLQGGEDVNNRVSRLLVPEGFNPLVEISEYGGEDIWPLVRIVVVFSRG